MLPGGLTKRQLYKHLERDQFADYLPWVAWDPDNGRYLTQEGALGYIWECSPLAFANDDLIAGLEGIFALEYTSRAVIQFILFADNDVAPILDQMRAKVTTDNPTLRRWADRYTDYLEQGSVGVDKLGGIPTRRFRLFVTVKNGEGEKELSDATIRGIEDYLEGAYLAPRKVTPNGLLRTMRSVFGVPVSYDYEKDIPIRKQVLRAEDEIDVEGDIMRLGNHYAQVLTPKSLPERFDLLQMNQLFGGVFGATDDPQQIQSPFIYTLRVFPQPVGDNIAARAEAMGWQKAAGSFVPLLKKRLEEFEWAIGKDDGKPFLRIIPSLTILHPNPQVVRSNAARATRIWGGRGAKMQHERALQQILFLSGLPLGDYNVGRYVDMLDRHFMPPAESVAAMLPIQGDFAGGRSPRHVYVGRKGQLIGFDLFDERADNHNFIIQGESGKGKSVLTQQLLAAHYASGCDVRILDIGYSYKKPTKVIKGRFLDLTEDFVLNPFDGAEGEGGLETTKAILLQMAFSNQASTPNEIAHSLMMEAARWVVKQGSVEDGVDKVHSFLATFPNSLDNGQGHWDEEIIRTARTLAFTMQDFVGDGPYAQYVRGRSTLDLSKDRWAVLELEGLSSRPSLFSVVTLMVINMVTQSLYLKAGIDRVPTIILFDEAWKFLQKAGADTTLVAQVIAEGMRRARKYYGSFGVVTQSILDTAQFGNIGDVLRGNAQYKFYLQSGDYALARERHLIDYDPFTTALLESVKSQRPRYVECFIEGGEAIGRGVVRVVLDPFSYWLFTSSAGDNKRIEQAVSAGRDYADAIEQLANEAA